MKLLNSFAILVSTSILALAGCGSSTIGGGTGGDGGTGGTGGGGGGDDLLCGGVPSDVSCESTGCPDGFTCVKDADPTTCHSSNCSCDPENGWVCTDDCGMGGSTCLPAPALCNNTPSPVSCETTGCPDGWTCTPDPDPTTCHPSICSCDAASGWGCTDDCGMGGSTCVMGL